MCIRDRDTAMELPLSLGVVAFTKDKAKAPAQAKALADKILPAAVISVEACGGNAKGVYHNAVGKDVTALEAKSDVLWNEPVSYTHLYHHGRRCLGWRGYHRPGRQV